MIHRGICSLCVHYDLDPEENPICAAFPQGIPVEIFSHGFDHRQPFDGDEGIMFSPDEGVTPEQVDSILAAVPTRPEPPLIA